MTSFPTERNPHASRGGAGRSEFAIRWRAIPSSVTVTASGSSCREWWTAQRRPRPLRSAPRLAQRPFQESLAAAIGLPVIIENSGKACALAQAWSSRSDPGTAGGFVFVNVSDGLAVRDDERAADSRRAQCGRRVRSHSAFRWMVRASARHPRMLGGARVESRDRVALSGASLISAKPIPSGCYLADRRRSHLPRAARRWLAVAALRATAQYLGAGLAAVVNAVDPARIYIGGEITDGLGHARAHRRRCA